VSKGDAVGAPCEGGEHGVRGELISAARTGATTTTNPITATTATTATATAAITTTTTITSTITITRTSVCWICRNGTSSPDLAPLR
jgi:hypothetical protein